MTVSIADLRALVYEQGYIIREAPLDVLGYADVKLGIVWLDEGLSQRQQRSTLAHELVHIGLRHDGARAVGNTVAWNGSREPWLENAVDVIAAGMLFTETDFQAAQDQQANPRLENVSRALGVDRQLLRAWLDARSTAQARRGGAGT